MPKYVIPGQLDLTLIDVVPGTPKLVKDLRHTHDEYTAWKTEWIFLTAVYEGVKQLVDNGHLEQHERESDEAFIRRMKELFGLNYSRAVVDLVNFYLFKKEPQKELPEALATDEAWESFLADCNHYGDPFPDYMADQSRWAAVMGHVGFLVDKPSVSLENKEQEKQLGIYPYLSVYHPPAILDWQYMRDITGRPQLAYLKLRDDDGTYRLWWPNKWEHWQEPETEDGGDPSDGMSGEKIDEGVNKLNEIPFVWLQNLRGRTWPIGVSDIHEIGRIDLSIVRELSQISEIIGFNAFPMLLAPMLEEGGETQDDVGPTAVIEFDPDNPNAKPEWLKPESEGALRAIWEGIEKKAREIYRIANVGGLQQVDTATVAKSGTALSAEFQQLNATIVQKAVNIEKAENKIMYFWMRWQNMDKLIDEAHIKRSRDYDVSSLSQDLANSLTAKTIVRSETFKKEVEKNVARASLPQADDETISIIEEEIDSTDAPEIGDPPNEQEPGDPRPEDEEEIEVDIEEEE